MRVCCKNVHLVCCLFDRSVWYVSINALLRFWYIGRAQGIISPKSFTYIDQYLFLDVTPFFVPILFRFLCWEILSTKFLEIKICYFKDSTKLNVERKRKCIQKIHLASCPFIFKNSIIFNHLQSEEIVKFVYDLPWYNWPWTSNWC